MGTNNVFYHTVSYGSSATTKTFNGFGLHPPTGHYFTKWLSGDTGTLLSQNTSYSYDKFSIDSQTANDQPCWLTAQFSPKQLKIIFNKNDGTGNTASQTVTYGTASQAFGKNTDGTYIWGNTGDFGKWSRTGHTLLGWSKSETATSASWSPYNGIASSWIESNTTENTALSELNLYAVWKLINFTVTFNAQGGTVSPTSKTVTYESTYGDLPTPTKTGNTFKGWYTASSGGTKITSSTTVTITADQTLYAQWTVNSYTNKVRHYQQRDPGVDSANSNGWKFIEETTFSANYGSTVTVPQNQVQTYDGHYNTGSANSNAWDWVAKDIGKDTFVQPANAITIEYYYNGYILTVKYKTGKVDIGTLFGTSLTTSKLNETDVFYEHSDSYGNQFNDGSGLMNYNNSTGIFLRKYGYRVPSGSEWRNVSNTSKTCTQDGSISTQSVASNLGVSLKTSNQTVIVEPNWQEYNLVKIYNGSSWVNAVPMLYDGSSWRETIPYIYKNDTDKWTRSGP